MVLVIALALAPRGVAGLGVLPTGRLFQGLVTLQMEVLVVQVVRTNINTRLVAGQHTIYPLGIVENLLSLGSELKFLDGDLPLRVRPDGLLLCRIGVLDSTLSQVLSVGHMRDRNVAGVRVLKGIGNLIDQIIRKRILAGHHHRNSTVRVDMLRTQPASQHQLALGQSEPGRHRIPGFGTLDLLEFRRRRSTFQYARHIGQPMTVSPSTAMVCSSARVS